MHLRANLNHLWSKPEHLFSIFSVISLLISGRGITVGVSFPEKRPEDHAGYCLLITEQMKAPTLLPTALHPWVEGSRGMQSPPNLQTGWAFITSSSSPPSPPSCPAHFTGTSQVRVLLTITDISNTKDRFRAQQ